MSVQKRYPLWRATLSFANKIERPCYWMGEVAAWLFVPLVLIILFDAVSRRYLRKLWFVVENDWHFFFNSPAMQDAEWHLHTMIFLLALGYAFAMNAHIRLDIFRPRFGARGRLAVEFLGGLFLLIPFVAIFAYNGYLYFESAWVHNEGYGESNGIGFRWFIKSFILIGPSLLFLAGVSIVLRLLVRIFGPEELAEETGTKQISDPSFSAFD